MDERKIKELFQSGQIDRRTFLQLMAGLASGTALAAVTAGCAPAPAPTQEPQGAEPTSTVPTAAPTTAPATAAPTYPSGVLKIAQGSDIDTMDVHISRGGVTSQLLSHMIGGLATRLHTGEFVPHLIKSMESEDELTHVLHLHEGVVFHNGEKFDASVVKFNFDRFADPATGTMQGGEKFTAYFKSCEVVDEYTVKFITASALAPMLEFIPHVFQMMSPKAIADLGPDIVNRAVGTGPFKFVEWTPGEKLVMEAYEDYWQGPPKLARVEWRPVLEAATRIVELKTGGADIIDQVPAENIAELEQAGGIQIFRLASEQPECIELNCAREPFNNVKVRQALNYAIDRDSIVQYVMLGAGEPQVTFLSPSHAGTDPDLKPYPYDPDKARSLLEEAGYPNGFKFTLSGPSGRYYKDKEVLEAVGSQLEAIGLTVELNIMEWGAYIGDFVKEPRVYDAGMIGYGDSGTFKSIYTAVYSKSPSYGWYGYTNPDFDTLFDEAMGTFDDNERDLKVRELRQILYDDAPFIYIAAPQILFAARDNVHDFYPWPSGNFWLREGDGCYVS